MPNEEPAREHRVYCAGPLFNQSERDEMTRIADALCESGFLVFLPHRDGMEFRLVHEELISRGWPAKTAAQFLHAAIFALDVYQLAVECDSMVWNLNGRTPDEGAVSEAAMAWILGKPIVAYKDDVRTLIAGQDNPLVAGLVDFKIRDTIGELPGALAEAVRKKTAEVTGLPESVQQALENGRRLWAEMQRAEAQGNNSALADVVEQLFAPQTQKTGPTETIA